MKWNNRIRQTHRWLSIALMLVVIGVSVAAASEEPPADWVFYTPLPLLAVLALSGLYLFALPYAAKWRSRRRA